MCASACSLSSPVAPARAWAQQRLVRSVAAALQAASVLLGVYLVGAARRLLGLQVLVLLDCQACISHDASVPLGVCQG